ncbi:MAG: AAA family ATPase [Hydrococcus sp. RU_2_2]|nr:AAA family ATPase [Hydrococcus sp. RU_2_2]NJP21106.1 AAA family ATPase [Hydrococcus sp. CRU_1_1]
MSVTFSPLIEQMQKPEFYPHPVREPIQLIQTHASSVLLTGNYAYKLKKSVDFGFLDFSTLSKRQYFLNEELRMNQVIAPDIYLAVLPITKIGEKFILEGTGELVEYVLKMSQFPQETLLINMYEKGTLTEKHIEELGKVVACFHEETITNEYIRSFGEIEKIKSAIDENYDRTKKYIGITQNQKQYDETRQFTDTFLLKNKTLFKQRQDREKIRECHGDLHLKNICFWHDKIQLFDRIEFNESFRFVDVMYDVAFTVMDLDARGRKDFGNLFLNTYIERAGDWEGLQVLPLYLSRQAYVRAKVNSLLLDDRAISEEDKQSALQTATNYYHLAWEYTKTSQGQLILMSGLSGSGKSTVARQLAKRINAIHIRSDAVRKHLAGISIDHQGSDELYAPQMNQRTYDRLLELSKMLLERGFSVILDAKYDRQNLREPVINYAQSNNIPLRIIYCTATLEIFRDRISQRKNDISDATPDLLLQQQATAEPFSESEQAYVTTIDTTDPDWIAQLNF